MVDGVLFYLMMKTRKSKNRKWGRWKRKTVCSQCRKKKRRGRKRVSLVLRKTTTKTLKVILMRRTS